MDDSDDSNPCEVLACGPAATFRLYLAADGSSPPKEFLNNLDQKIGATFLAVFDRMVEDDNFVDIEHVAMVENDIFEVRVGSYSMLCFRIGVNFYAWYGFRRNFLKRQEILRLLPVLRIAMSELPT